MQRKRGSVILFVALLVLGGFMLVFGWQSKQSPRQPASTTNATNQPLKGALAGRTFYNDTDRPVSRLVKQYQADGKTDEAVLLRKIADQPGTTWLTGPHTNDPTARHDIEAVMRTSAKAASEGTTPLYELYAIPQRDACAAYSKNGFATAAQYLSWVDRIIAALHTSAVFSIEADAVPQALQTNCLSASQTEERYALLKSAIAKLHTSPHVAGVYLDAGNPEWFPDPQVLVEPLRKAGIAEATGIGVNISYYVRTAESVAWSQKLVGLLGGGKSAIIDTSRNGQGVMPASAKGEARWCNAPGRGLGPVPTTYVKANHVDAYFWGKNIGESDGSCFGNPAAGTFVPQLALQLAQNANFNTN